MANTPFQLFKPTDINDEEIYLGEGALGYDDINSGYPLKWTTRLENKGRLYKKSEFTFRTNGYMRSDDIVKTAIIKQKGQPIFSEPSIISPLRSGNALTSINSPTLITHVITLTGDIPLDGNYILNITNETNAQWLEISISYDTEDYYINESTVITLASLGDTFDDIYDGGNRSQFLNKIRESLLYEFLLRGIEKLGGYQSKDEDEKQVFRMYYPFNNDSPTANFTDFMGIGTSEDFLNYITSEVANGNTSVENATYTQLKIGELSSTDLKLVGNNNTSYQDYYMDTKTYGETNTFGCNISFNANPTYTLVGTGTDVHYFDSFANPLSGNYYLDNNTAFIFHINIKPRGFAKKWSSESNNYNNYYQWNYVPYDIKIVIMLAEPTPYLEFNNSTLNTNDFVLLEAQEGNTKSLPVNSNMLWNIDSLNNTGVYDVTSSEAEGESNLYIGSNIQ